MVFGFFLPTNTNEKLFSYIQLFVIFGHLFNDINKGNLKYLPLPSTNVEIQTLDLRIMSLVYYHLATSAGQVH